MNDQRDEHEAAAHLIELGYVDPQEDALREMALRRELEAELQQATNAIKQGRVAEAMATLDRLIVDDPDWVAPHQLLAEIHYRSGRRHEARAELTWLEHHGVESPRLSLLAAGLAVGRRDFPAALELLEYASYVDPELPSVHSLFASVLLRLGNLERAKAAFEQALKHNPADARAMDGLASISLRQGEYEAAAEWALSAVEKEMQLSRAHYHLGLALSKIGRPTEALAAFEACARIDPIRVAPYFWMLRIAQQQLDDPQRAEHYRTLGRQLLQQRLKRRAASHSRP